MDLKSKYITADEFKLYSGIDLAIELKDDDNSSQKVDAFLYKIEKRMEAYIDGNYHQSVERRYPEFTDHQKECYKLALLEQAIYVLNNNEISEDSGYDQERGVVASRDVLRQLALSENARLQLINCGLINTQVLKRRVGWSDRYDF